MLDKYSKLAPIIKKIEYRDSRERVKQIYWDLGSLHIMPTKVSLWVSGIVLSLRQLAFLLVLLFESSLIQ